MRIQKGIKFNEQNLKATVKAQKAVDAYVSLDISYNAFSTGRTEISFYVWSGKLNSTERFSTIEMALDYLESFAQ